MLEQSRQRQPLRTLCGAAGQRRPVQFAPHAANNSKRFPQAKSRHGGGVLPHVRLQPQHFAPGTHRPQGVERRQRSQQRPAHKRPGCTTSFLHTPAKADTAAQHELRRGLCAGADVLPSLPHRAHLRRTVPLPPLARQQRRCPFGGESEHQQPLQGPSAHA